MKQMVVIRKRSQTVADCVRDRASPKEMPIHQKTRNVFDGVDI